MTLAREHRRAIPLGVKVKSALAAAGFSEEEIEGGDVEFDHFPALGLRVVDEVTGELVPPANDWRFIRPLRKGQHKIKSNGRAGEKRSTSYGSDVHAIAKMRRLTKQREDVQRRLLEKDAGEPRPEPAPRKRKIPSRPFPRRRA